MPGIDKFEEMCVISASGSPVISPTESSPTFPVQNSSEADADPDQFVTHTLVSHVVSRKQTAAITDIFDQLQMNSGPEMSVKILSEKLPENWKRK